MPGRICLDTNIAIDILNGDLKLLKLVDDYEAIVLPIVVIGELRYGAYRSSKQSENLEKIDALAKHCEIVDVGPSVATIYGSLRALLMSAGTPIPENDIWIAACCLSIYAPLITNDKHFKQIPRLKTFSIS
ncbi:MAG: type II toxin-antitoxin system VapC family toxin [Chitinivibrionales bacterium]|nr:type II toxin-antitoxin system VapC family toxin [Chitinivibrionales bacterium]